MPFYIICLFALSVVFSFRIYSVEVVPDTSTPYEVVKAKIFEEVKHLETYYQDQIEYGKYVKEEAIKPPRKSLEQLEELLGGSLSQEEIKYASQAINPQQALYIWRSFYRGRSAPTPQEMKQNLLDGDLMSGLVQVQRTYFDLFGEPYPIPSSKTLQNPFKKIEDPDSIRRQHILCIYQSYDEYIYFQRRDIGLIRTFTRYLQNNQPTEAFCHLVLSRNHFLKERETTYLDRGERGIVCHPRLVPHYDTVYNKEMALRQTRFFYTEKFLKLLYPFVDTGNPDLKILLGVSPVLQKILREPKSFSIPDYALLDLKILKASKLDTRLTLPEGESAEVFTDITLLKNSYSPIPLSRLPIIERSLKNDIQSLYMKAQEEFIKKGRISEPILKNLEDYQDIFQKPKPRKTKGGTKAPRSKKKINPVKITSKSVSDSNTEARKTHSKEEQTAPATTIPASESLSTAGKSSEILPTSEKQESPPQPPLPAFSQEAPAGKSNRTESAESKASQPAQKDGRPSENPDSFCKPPSAQKPLFILNKREHFDLLMQVFDKTTKPFTIRYSSLKTAMGALGIQIEERAGNGDYRKVRFGSMKAFWYEPPKAMIGRHLLKEIREAFEKFKIYPDNIARAAEAPPLKIIENV